MMKALDSGISGLQSHQIAMDVESNNIANVNTIGFKYSRANFSDLLAQTSQIATAPQGSLGGKNSVQIGLGTSINSVTKIMSQGSIQSTDKNTDVAIQGDGFFIVSPDGGNNYKYSRSGDFKFDASGNFVDNNGFIVQGWSKDPKTGLVDATAPIGNIQIPAGLTTPAQASSQVVIKANLSSSALVTQFAPTNALPSGLVVDLTAQSEDMGVMFNAAGQAMQLTAPTTATDSSGNITTPGGQGLTVSLTDNSTPTPTTTTIQFRYTDGINVAPNSTATDSLTGQNIYYFNNTEDLRAGLQAQADSTSPGATVTVDALGKFKITNGSNNLNITVAAITDTNTVPNTRFTDTFSTLGGILNAGEFKQSQSLNATTHSTSIDVFDSLGSKHTVKIDFRKESVTPITKWSYAISVPTPGSLDVTTGAITFNSSGAMMGDTTPSITFSPNNGAKGGQTIALDFGTTGSFGGITSFDNASATSGISQDGFPGGDLEGIRIDQSGTLVGSFSNGRSFGLAQIGMAKFANNEGLVSDGGNSYMQSANSGGPIIGTAATAGRGFMQASSLEGSNVDLSKSLTNLIVIQRGYQQMPKRSPPLIRFWKHC